MLFFFLSQHHRTGEKPMDILIVGKALNIALILLHQGTHTGENPYKHNQCGRAFRRCSHFFQHKRTHTTEHYEWSQCWQAFNYSYHLICPQEIHIDLRNSLTVINGKAVSWSSILLDIRNKPQRRQNPQSVFDP